MCTIDPIRQQFTITLKGYAMLATVNSGAVFGMDAVAVTVEVDYNPRAMTSFTIVGLPDTAVQESRERVRAAIKNRGLDFPMKRYTVNLAPADLKKVGPVYDLPIAMGVSFATLRTESVSAVSDGLTLVSVKHPLIFNWA